MGRKHFRVYFSVVITALFVLSGCGGQSTGQDRGGSPDGGEPGSVQGELKDNALQEGQTSDMNINAGPEEPGKIESSYEVREGISGFTLQYNDLPEAYQVASSFSYELMDRRPPLPEDDSTVLNAVPDPAKTEVFYLWEEGNAPARTRFTSDMTGYYDSYDFRN